MAPVRVTVLGSGTSQGVPMIGCPCAVCRSDDPRDRRTRSSLYVDDGVFPFLIDTTPELRLQCLAAGVTRVEAVLFTHNHADHVFGFDDLRRFCEANGRPLDIHGSAETIALLRQTFFYAFDTSIQVPHYVRTTPHVFTPDAPVQLGTLTVWPLRVVHGRAETHGFLIEREGRKLLAYIPDAKEIPEAARARLQGVELAILDGLRDDLHPTHMSTAEAVAAGRAIGAGRTVLTHLTHHKSHAAREGELPPGCEVAYDGLTWAL